MPLTPLIEASSAYPAMEKLVLSAKESVWLGFRIFDPATRLRSEEAHALGLQTWSDLALWSCANHVAWHVRLTDFDPIGATDLHALCWRAVRLFQQVQAEHPGQMCVLPALHAHQIGFLAHAAFWLPAYLRLTRRMKRFAENGSSQTKLQSDYPGLMPYLDTNAPNGKVRLPWSCFAMHPVVHHEKLMIIDQDRMILGGLDVNERRFDNHDHDRPADDTWHDVSVQVDGEDTNNAVTAASHHFVSLWNAERVVFNTRPISDGMAAVSTLAAPRRSTVDSGAKQSARFIRTVAEPAGGLFRIGPRTVCHELESEYLKLIAQAQNLLYVETQYLRSNTIADGLARRAAENSDLHLIVILPAAPDDVAFDGNTGPDAKHGAWLQAKAVEKISKAFGKRALFLSLVGAKEPVASDPATADLAYAAGQPLIYVHSKVMIADGEVAIIASSNLNGRSMRWDTESGVVWQDRKQVRAFQSDLWGAHFKAQITPDDDLDAADILQVFAEAASPLSDTFLAPYPKTRAKRFAASHFYIPDNIV